MYEKLGLVEESDLERYRKKLGIRKGIDLTEIDLDDVDSMLEAAAAGQVQSTQEKNAAGSQGGNPKKKQTSLQRRKIEFDKEEFKKIVSDLQNEKLKLQQMDDQERAAYQEEKLKLKEVFRDEDVKHFPMIIKASTAGTLETLL